MSHPRSVPSHLLIIHGHKLSRLGIHLHHERRVRRAFDLVKRRQEESGQDIELILATGGVTSPLWEDAESQRAKEFLEGLATDEGFELPQIVQIASRSTHEDIVGCRAYCLDQGFEPNSITVVSSEYHRPRLEMLYSRLWPEVVELITWEMTEDNNLWERLREWVFGAYARWDPEQARNPWILDTFRRGHN